MLKIKVKPFALLDTLLPFYGDIGSDILFSQLVFLENRHVLHLSIPTSLAVYTNAHVCQHTRIRGHRVMVCAPVYTQKHGMAGIQKIEKFNVLHH